jgi:peroxiredoxin
MGLQEKLDAKKKEFESSAPEKALKIMHRATQDLRKSGIAERALKEGEEAPDFTLNNAYGKPVRLNDVLAKGPAVLGFYRGRWWPYCNLELDALQAAVSEIESLGASLLLVSPQLEEHSLALKKTKNLTMTLLSDPGNRVAEKYGLVYTFPDDLKQVYLQFHIDLEKYNGDPSWRLPMPARYIVDPRRVIRYSEVSPDYTVRPDPSHTVEALKKVVG